MHEIKLEPVNGSTQVAAIGHDPASETLAVKFHSGATYHYQGVNGEKFEALRASNSKGKHLHVRIKPHHKATKVSP